MSKVIPVSDIGVPVPSGDISAVQALVCYYGPKGFTPSYTQSARVVVPLSSLKQVQSNGANYWDVPVSAGLPASVPDGAYDFCFTLCDTADGTGSEGDFSPVLTEVIDRTVPPTLGQPIILG